MHSHLPDMLIKNEKIRLLFVWVDNFDIDSLGYEFLLYIGGKGHIYCVNIRTPLIVLVHHEDK